MDAHAKVCDFCRKILKVEGTDLTLADEPIFRTNDVECCENCNDIYSAVYERLADEMQNMVNFSVRHRLFILNSLIEVKDEDVLRLFGTSGLDFKNQLIEDLQKE